MPCTFILWPYPIPLLKGSLFFYLVFVLLCDALCSRLHAKIDTNHFCLVSFLLFINIYGFYSPCDNKFDMFMTDSFLLVFFSNNLRLIWLKTVEIFQKIYEFRKIDLIFMLFKHSTQSRKSEQKKNGFNKIRCVLSGDWDRNNNRKKSPNIFSSNSELF